MFAALGGVVAVLAAGCSASDTSSSTAGNQPAVAGQGDAQKAPGKADSAVGTATDRQVVMTGNLTLVTDHPTTTVKDVVALVDSVKGRVDSRSETAATHDGPGSASLTVRVPSDKVTATIDGLRALGTVSNLTTQAQDVTAAAQDLDARIAAQKISVARMEDVLSRAANTSDVVAAEDALRQRQSDLEAMVAERGRIADQVSMSTLSITLTAPSLVEASGPSSFPAALAAGWRSLVDGLGSFALVLGVALPWLVFLGLITWAIVWVVRRRRRRRGPRPGQRPGDHPAAPGAPYGPVPMAPTVSP